MRTTLAENIRNFRKERRLTQEQLAEVMGVTTGAVHKWESGASIPELSIIMGLADFYDVSVDVLVGHRMKDNSQEATVQRLCGYLKTMDTEALQEAGKALKKYPNSFDVVYICAKIYMLFGTGKGGREKVMRALELLEQARILLPQNNDPKISALSIYGDMASAYMILGDYEKAVEFMKMHNESGIFSDTIGVALAFFMKRYKEAETFLSDAMLQHISGLMNTITGMYTVFCYRREYDSAIDIIYWGQELLTRLNRNDSSDIPDYLNKSEALDMILIANVKLLSGNREEAEELLKKAYETARKFDTVPNYGIGSFKYISDEEVSLHDMIGVTAIESAENILSQVDNSELTKMWKKIRGM